MSYTRNPIVAPKLSGAVLKSVVALAERPLAGRAIRRKMLSSIGLDEMRAAPLDSETPVPFPLHAAPARSGGGESPSEMARRCVRASQPTHGFKFETIGDFAKAYRSGDITPEDVARNLLAAIDRSDLQDPPLRAFIACDPNDLMTQAKASAQRLSQGAPRSILDGVPIAIKDEVDQVPYPTTVGTSFLGGGPAAEDATAVARLRAAGALLIVAGKEYGTGSSRDWAAKGTKLLGVRAVAAASFERIHRSNLVGMGVLPLQFKDGASPKSLGLDGTETFDVVGLDDTLKPQSELTLRITKDGESREVTVDCRIDTPIEVDYYRHGGILPYVLRQLAG